MQPVLLKATIWLFTEVFLTMIGLDDLADYGEYIFKVRDWLPSEQMILRDYECWDGVCRTKDLRRK